jgi:hypothetical protein
MHYKSNQNLSIQIFGLYRWKKNIPVKIFLVLSEIAFTTFIVVWKVPVDILVRCLFFDLYVNLYLLFIIFLSDTSLVRWFFDMLERL